MPKEIPLTKGLVAIVDDCDYGLVSAFKWYADKGANTFYARRNVYSAGKQRGQKMHHFITGFAYVDHRDGNGLNNCRSNLRESNKSLNAANSRKRRDGITSAFKGVHWHKRANKWCAAIRKDGKTFHLGYFVNEEDAARAYAVAALEKFGAFSKTA